jgi:hypothetical protein
VRGRGVAVRFLYALTLAIIFLGLLGAFVVGALGQ